MSWDIPLTDVVFDEDDLDAVAECLRSGWLTMGPRTKAFEAAVAADRGAPHAVAVSSGTAALHLACAALGLGARRRGDRARASRSSPRPTRRATSARRPCSCDVVSPHAPNVDPADVERKITPRTKAVIAVHMLRLPGRHRRAAGALRRARARR